jgi:hypothetical protein
MARKMITQLPKRAVPYSRSLVINRLNTAFWRPLDRIQTVASSLTMDFKDSNYWLDTVTMPTGTPGAFAERADVAVIGAGFTGLSAARTLAKGGATVVVLEANGIGWGASSRNGGMVLTGLKLSTETLAARYGMEATRRMYAASLASIDLVEQIVR